MLPKIQDSSSYHWKNPLWLMTNLNIGSNMSLFMSVVRPWMDGLLAVKVSEMWSKPEVLKESIGKCKSVPLSYCQAESWPCLKGPKELLIFDVKPIMEMNECADARIRKCIIDHKVICCCEQQLLCLTDRWRSHSTQPLLSSFMCGGLIVEFYIIATMWQQLELQK